MKILNMKEGTVLEDKNISFTEIECIILDELYEEWLQCMKENKDVVIYSTEDDFYNKFAHYGSEKLIKSICEDLIEEDLLRTCLRNKGKALYVGYIEFFISLKGIKFVETVRREAEKHKEKQNIENKNKILRYLGNCIATVSSELINSYLIHSAGWS